MNYLSTEQIREIGLEYVFNNVRLFTSMARARIKKLDFFGSQNQDLLQREYDNIEKISDYIIYNKGFYPKIAGILGKIKDISGSIKNLENSKVLDMVELHEIKLFCYYSNELINFFELWKIDIDEIELKGLIKEYSLLDPENLRLPTFMIYDSYSQDLRKIRSQKRDIERLMYKESNSLEYENMLKTRRELVNQEESNEAKIRKKLSEELYSSITNLSNNLQKITYIDILLGKAKFAIENKCNKPRLLDSNDEIEIIDMHNPYFGEILSLKGKEYVSISLSLKVGSTVITGANMGGKSLTLKTLCLNIALSQLGFYCFAKSMKVPLLDFIFMISDDMQSVNRGLSSFGAEIKGLHKAIEAANSYKGLIIIDELARGTNPKEGRSIVNATLKYLNDKPSYSIISTHYDGVDLKGIKQYRVIGLKNVDFEEVRLKYQGYKVYPSELLQELMDYRLELSESSEVPKDALNICNFLGLNEELFNLIEQYYKEEK